MPDAFPRPIHEIARQLGLGSDDVEPYGWFKGKLKAGLDVQRHSEKVARYVGVTAVNPTPLGEGKTVTAIALSMALSQLGHRSIATLREPSLGPVFGIKGGGAGGGKATLLPADDINLHFTGDMHAVAAANNLLAAMIDNHVQRGQRPVVDPATISWRRCVDMNDKGLAHIVSGLDNRPQAPLRETGFDLTAASEVMAILSLATSLTDLRQRLGRITVGFTETGEPVIADDLQCAGAMAALLRDALRPNLVQTCEHTPALVHTGPFANIAHGNSSVLADQIAMQVADFVITESGFGADCGAEKLFNIKCRTSGLRPSAEVLVCTVRAIKYHSGQFDVHPGRELPVEMLDENPDALRAGIANLQAHVDIIRRFGVPVIVAINRFPSDVDGDINLLKQLANDMGVEAVVIEPFTNGGAGTVDLARTVVDVCSSDSHFEFLYPSDLPLEEKLEAVATEIYGADGVDLLAGVHGKLQTYSSLGFGDLPICIAKTQYSLSHDPKLLGRPKGFRLPIRDVHLASGAGFIYAIAGDISTMPGLPRSPAAQRIDIDKDGQIVGLQ
ncbi:MAG: formate--tetrahydrofolate ligase [Rhodopirellula sp.]|nr:formate--tetrahydrofolate ligase [Rhodopirellula sp.]